MKFSWLLVASLALLVMVVPASAIVVIDFGTGNMGSGGTLAIGGGNAVGTDIPVNALTVNGTGANGVYDTFGLATGSGLGAGTANGAARLDFSTVGLGSITITGGVCSLGNETCNAGTGPGTIFDPSEVLLQGTFSSWSLTNGAFVGSINASGPDTKGPGLLAALGVPAGTKFDFFGFSIGFNLAGGGSPYTVTSTDIINTEVPEPASIVLLGTLMVGVVQVVRRRSTKKA